MRITAYEDPMEDNLIHTLLVTTDRMQRIPALVVALILLFFAGMVAGLWALLRGAADAQQVGLIVVGLSLLDWFSLWLLPRAKRSFGPDRPSALALGAVRGIVTLIPGVIFPVWLVAIANALISTLALYATWVEPFRLSVTRQTLTYSAWRADAPPLKVLHIGDLHLERITPRERRLNQYIRELQPDLIVFSGDFVNISYVNDPQTEADIREIISAWSAPLGVYCVAGTYTVEPVERVRQFVAGLDNLRLLEDEWVTIEAPGGALQLLGMTTTHFVERDRETVRHLAEVAPLPDGFRLLVTHAPDVAPEADEAGYHLYVCGHTHGGQLRFPVIGAVFSGSALGNDFIMGRYDLKHCTVYTSRGVGMEGMGAPRARFLCPPEIILWEIGGSG